MTLLYVTVMADQPGYIVDTDPTTGLVTVTTFGPQSQQYPVQFTSSVPITPAALTPSPTLLSDFVAAAAQSNTVMVTKTTPTKSVTKVNAKSKGG